MGHRIKRISNATTLNLNYNPFFCDCHSINIMLQSPVIIQDLMLLKEGYSSCYLTGKDILS